MNRFVAKVKHEDFKGSVAADVSDTKIIEKYLVQKGLCTGSERVAATRFGFRSNRGAEVEIANLIFYLVDSERSSERPETVRSIEVDMSLPQFFSFYKRFDFVICSSRDQLNEETIINGPHYD